MKLMPTFALEGANQSLPEALLSRLYILPHNAHSHIPLRTDNAYKFSIPILNTGAKTVCTTRPRFVLIKWEANRPAVATKSPIVLVPGCTWTRVWGRASRLVV